MSSHFLDIIQGLTQLKIFNASKREIAAVKKISDDYGDQTMGVLKIAFLSSFVLEFLASISIALVAVVLGFRLYYGDVDYVFALWVLLLAPEFYLPFRQLGTQYHAKMAGVTAAEDLVDILSQPVPERSLQTTFTAPFTIKLAQVEFAYPQRSNTLSNINIELSSQGLYAVIGESGSGKSTLTDLVLGFITPNSGQVTINEQLLTSANRDNWLQHCGWISQQAQVFYGSLAFNIAMSDDYQEDRVKDALQKSGLSSFVQSLEQGINSKIGEAGAGLSGGQAQRLALARVFYHQPKVLILDEPTSYLDQETEKIITSSINDYAKNNIVVVIAHRLHTVIDAKKIIVLEQGKVIESGTHQELLTHNGYYAQQVLLKGNV
jgi:ATP-binding cassette subfamily C protein CydD